jgi:hypothetical protein
MSITVPFVKGHCGWDAVTLLAADQLSPECELEVALKIMDAPVNGGLEVGFLRKGARDREIRLRMADSTTRNWVPMCGGMTQVIGKALVESAFRNYFQLDVSGPRLCIMLITDSAVVPIEIEIERGRVRQTTTVMDDYVAFLYRRGVTALKLDGVRALQADDMIIIEIAALEDSHPELDFTRRDRGPHLDVVNQLLVSFQQYRECADGTIGMLYDDRPEGPGQFRLFPRFFSADLSAINVPFEFQCGTGTVGVGVALAYHKQLPFDGPEGRVVFEWGSQRVTPDPYGIRTSTLDLSIGDGRVSAARFTHSVVEVLAEGILTLPGYGVPR